MKISRRKLLIGSLSAIGSSGILYTHFVEPGWYEITEKNITINRFNTPLRILHLSDLHASPAVSLKSIEQAIDTSLALKAEIAFLTGDFITHKLQNQHEYQRILSKLSTQIPTFACVGNHDGGRWAGARHGYPDFSKVQNLLEQSNIKLLFNEQTQVTIHDKTFSVAGLGDYWSGDTKPAKVLTTTRKQNQALFVLSHNPDSKTDLKPYDWDLLCCGHTHGGQLVIPILDYRPFLPVDDKSFPEGLLSWGQRHIHITRGVGNLHGMRFNCRPEISILNVK